MTAAESMLSAAAAAAAAASGVQEHAGLVFPSL